MARWAGEWGSGMSLVAIVLVLGAVALLKYLVTR